jgi:hypothetical protein
MSGSTMAGVMRWAWFHSRSRRVVARAACISFAAALLLNGLVWTAHADPLPNIVYILADDMGLGEVTSYMAGAHVATPNIDRIANAGMRFTDAHSASSVCTPSRYSIPSSPTRAV